MTENSKHVPDGEPIVPDLLAGLREDRTETTNRNMVDLALRIPDLLATLFAVRDGDDRTVAAGSADTITKVAERDSRALLPYQAYVARGLDSPIAQVRWESLTTLALLAAIDPGIIAPLVSRLDGIIEQDASVIARDRAIDALTVYGVSSTEAALLVVPVLIATVSRWTGKHAARALRSLQDVAPLVPDMHPALRALAAEQAASHRPSVRTAAKRLAVVVSTGR